MPLATATIDGAILDLLGIQPVPSIITLQVVDTNGAQVGHIAERFGPRSWDTRRDGTLTLPGVPQLPQTGFEQLRWQATITPKDRRRRTARLVFDLLGDTTWGDILQAFLDTLVKGGQFVRDNRDGTATLLIGGGLDNDDGTLALDLAGITDLASNTDGTATVSPA